MLYLFYFFEKTIGFVSGLTVNIDNTKLIITLSFKNKYALIKTIDKIDVKN
jgi:hypothetical protein